MLCTWEHYKHWTWDPRTDYPRTRGPITQGPEVRLPKDPRSDYPRTRGPKEPRTGDPRPRFLRAVLDYSSSYTTMQAISANATCLTHNYILYWSLCSPKALFIADAILTSLILGVVCQFCKARLVHRYDTQSERVWRLVAFDLWPLDHSANNYRELVTLVVLHAIRRLFSRKLAQSGTKSVNCVAITRICDKKRYSRTFELGTLTQVEHS